MINTKLNLDYLFNFSKNSILSRSNQDRYFFLIYMRFKLLLKVLLDFIWQKITNLNNQNICVKLN